jgi:hypothetical protein
MRPDPLQPYFFLSALRVVLCNTLRHGAPLAGASAETLRLQASISVGLDRVIGTIQAILTSVPCTVHSLPRLSLSRLCLSSPSLSSLFLVFLLRECALHDDSSSQLSAQACIHCPAQASHANVVATKACVAGAVGGRVPVVMCDGSFACEQTSFTRRSHARCFSCILHCRMRMIVTNAWHSDTHTTHSPSCGTAEHCMHTSLHGLFHNVAINIVTCVQVTRSRHPCGACSNRPRSPIFQVWGCPRRHPDQGACHPRRAR